MREERFRRLMAFGAVVPLVLVQWTVAAPAKAYPAAVRNAEDIIVLPGQRWVIASSMAEGGIEVGELDAVDVATNRVLKIFPNQRRPAPRSARCSAPPAEFKPHGIAYLPGADGGELFVVNHGERQSIEVFSVQQGKGAPQVRWVDCLPLPASSVGNAVAAEPGGIFATASFASDLRASTSARGAVLRWGDKGWTEVPQSTVDAPAGIIATADGRKVYVTSWLSSKVVELSLSDTQTQRRELNTSFRPDNLRWAANGLILVTGQAADSDTILGCAKSPNAECKPPVPGAFGEIEPKSFRLNCTLPAPNGASTVALDVRDERWFGAFRGLSIERVSRRACP